MINNSTGFTSNFGSPTGSPFQVAHKSDDAKSVIKPLAKVVGMVG
ncbi:MAG: hypothetical protein SQA66_07980 [Candidatus Fervidibacter sacchari]